MIAASFSSAARLRGACRRRRLRGGRDGAVGRLPGLDGGWQGNGEGRGAGTSSVVHRLKGCRRPRRRIGRFGRLFMPLSRPRNSVVRGAPTRVARRVQRMGGRERELPPLCASCDGWNLHAGVVVEAEDREGLLRLGRYLLRPPLAVDRLEVEPDGRVRFTMKRTFEDGTAALSFTAEELVSRLVALIPPPRANTIVYRGVSRGASSDRSRGGQTDRVIEPPPGAQIERTAEARSAERGGSERRSVAPVRGAADRTARRGVAASRHAGGSDRCSGAGRMARPSGGRPRRPRRRRRCGRYGQPQERPRPSTRWPGVVQRTAGNPGGRCDLSRRFAGLSKGLWAGCGRARRAVVHRLSTAPAGLVASIARTAPDLSVLRRARRRGAGPSSRGAGSGRCLPRSPRRGRGGAGGPWPRSPAAGRRRGVATLGAPDWT